MSKVYLLAIVGVVVLGGWVHGVGSCSDYDDDLLNCNDVPGCEIRSGGCRLEDDCYHRGSYSCNREADCEWVESGEEPFCAFKCGDMEDPDSCNLEDLKDLCRWTEGECEYVPYVSGRDECNGFSSGVCSTVFSYCEWRAGDCRLKDYCSLICAEDTDCEDRFSGDNGFCKLDKGSGVWYVNCYADEVPEQICKQTMFIGICEWDGSRCVGYSSAGFSFLPSSLLLISAAFLFLLF
jgi:hypothetical protein